MSVESSASERRPGRRRSILFVINGLGVGGAETQVIALMERFAARGHSVSLVTINNDMRLASALPEHFKHYALRVSGWRAAARAFVSFMQIVHEVRPDVVHGHLFQANVLSRMAKLSGLRCRVVNTTHCNYGLAHRRCNPYLIYRWTKGLVDVHTAVSGPALSALREWNSVAAERSMLLFNAIDVDLYRCAEPGHGRNPERSDRPFKWIAVGRLDPVKNYRSLLEAIRQLRESGHHPLLDIAGEGPQLDDLKHFVDKNCLMDHVRFLGLVRDLPSRLAEYDGYVISSDNEALPMALLEAMAAGLPVVGTQVGEIPALLSASEGGDSVRPGSPSELAEAMSSIMALDAEALMELGKRNRTHVQESFGMDRIVDMWEQLYSSNHRDLREVTA